MNHFTIEFLKDRVLQAGTFGDEPSILASSERMNTDLFTKRNTTQEKTRRLADTKASVIGDTLIAKGNQVTIDISHWQEQSACRQADPEMFFPIGSTGSALDRIHIAKMLCESCKVTETCLNYALETNQEAGVWGGYAEDERRRLRKRWLAERRKARIGV